LRHSGWRIAGSDAIRSTASPRPRLEPLERPSAGGSGSVSRIGALEHLDA
jgi:hypothetical protein